MTHKRADDSTRNGCDSEAKRLDAKRFGGESVLTGNIIIHQCGTKLYAGVSIDCGHDHTLFARASGKVEFEIKDPRSRKFINIEVE